jgi:photosystem II stability/assembly factor-like uncharacterized protein
MKTLAFLGALFAACGSQAFAQNWEPVTSGTTAKLFSLDFLNPDTGWIGGEGPTLRKTTDGGSSWSSQINLPGSVTVLQILNPTLGWAAGGTSSSAGFFLKTTNGGTTWNPQAIGNVRVVWGMSFVNSQVGWISTEGGGILKTTDGGSLWTSQPSGTLEDFRRMQFLDSSRGWVVGLNGTLRRTTNGGSNWTTSTTGKSVHLVGLHFLDASAGWCVGWNGTILKTTNGGTTWGAQTSGTFANLASVFFVNADIGYVSGDAGLILKTTDGGSSWDRQTTGTSQNINHMKFFSETAGWALGDQGMVLRSWVPKPPTQFAYAFNPITYEEGKPIPANVPWIQGTNPITYSSAYSLPPGLTMNPNTGVVTGTPAPGSSADVPAGQTYTYPVTATNSEGSATTDLVITITPPVTSITAGRSADAFTFQVGDGPPLVFPVPASGAGAVRMEIRNARGSKILDKKVTNDHFNWVPAGSREAPAGVYSLRLTWRDQSGRALGTSARTFIHLP